MRHNRGLLLLLTFTISYWMSVYFYVQILPGYVRYLGGSLAMVGLVGGAYGLTQVVFRIPVGIWSDRFCARKPFLYAGIICGLASNSAFLLASSPQALFWARAISGVSASVWVVITVFGAGCFPADQLDRGMGVMLGISNLGQLAATFTGPYLAATWGWRAPFAAALAAGVPGLASLILLGAEKQVAAERITWSETIAVGRHPSVLLASFLGILLQYGYWAQVGFAPLLAEQLGAGRRDLGLLSVCYMGPAMVASLSLGRLQSLLGKRRLTVLAFVLFALGFLLTPVARGFPVFCLLTIIASMGRGVISPVLMGMSISGILPNRKATAMGFFQALYAVGMFLGPTVSGVLAKGLGLSWTLFFAGLPMACGGCVWWFTTARATGQD